jgi:hypothetical protein
MALEVYDFIKLVHVLTAIFLVGSIPLEYMLVRRVLARGDRTQIAPLLADLEWIENRIAVPSALGLLASGLLMVYGPWARWPLFAEGVRFPLAGLVLWVILVIIFAVIVTGRYKRLRAWAESPDGPAQPMVAWQGWVVAGLGVALLAVFVMVTKTA